MNLIKKVCNTDEKEKRFLERQRIKVEWESFVLIAGSVLLKQFIGWTETSTRRDTKFNKSFEEIFLSSSQYFLLEVSWPEGDKRGGIKDKEGEDCLRCWRMIKKDEDKYSTTLKEHVLVLCCLVYQRDEFYESHIFSNLFRDGFCDILFSTLDVFLSAHYVNYSLTFIRKLWKSWKRSRKSLNLNERRKWGEKWVYNVYKMIY